MRQPVSPKDWARRSIAASIADIPNGTIIASTASVEAEVVPSSWAVVVSEVGASEEASAVAPGAEEVPGVVDPSADSKDQRTIQQKIN